MQSVYPRVCGGTSSQSSPRPSAKGLSPRVRGNRRAYPAESQRRGSIPACAGEPHQGQQGRGYQGGYPRGCGETLMLMALCTRLKGLSPRVRGNHHEMDVTIGAAGAIPAGAGKPSDSRSITHAPAGYPRGCGETVLWIPVVVESQGLSPRVRGNRGHDARGARCRRAIPAGAGKPAQALSIAEPPTGYPRGCGETAGDAYGRHSLYGLSPRVRGNPEHPDRCGHDGRAIPAGAGKPPTTYRSPYSAWGYPRGCGETRHRSVLRCASGGLSPRVRGNRRSVQVIGLIIRAIPAGAGKPCTDGGECVPFEGYPRGCGETFVTSVTNGLN